MTRRTPAVLAWVVALAAAGLALLWAGEGVLAGPPLTDPDRWAAWIAGRDPVVAAFGLLRLAALAGLWYLALVTMLGVAVRTAGSTSLVRLTDRVTIAPVRRLLAGGVSLGLAASGVVAVAAPAARLPVAAAAQPPATRGSDSPAATVTMHRLGPSELPPTPVPAPVPEVAATTSGGPADRWTVKPGECFWSIAESVLAERTGHSPTDAEIVPYWRRLIDANRHELVHPGDPDLILPGQVFVVPPP